MQAIITKYLGATNNKGARIKATCDAGSVTIGYPHEWYEEAAHASAAMALVKKLGWNDTTQYGHWVSGGLPDQSGYVFVSTKSCSWGAHHFNSVV
jgi:hypothetical protein